jgi:hypothetical protein
MNLQHIPQELVKLVLLVIGGVVLFVSLVVGIIKLLKKIFR